MRRLRVSSLWLSCGGPSETKECNFQSCTGCGSGNGGAFSLSITQ
ncbi:MAG: hypothetical protein ACO1OB_05650 [Archangium sp.]